MYPTVATNDRPSPEKACVTVLSTFGIYHHLQPDFKKAMRDTEAFIVRDCARYWAINEWTKESFPIPADTHMTIWLPGCLYSADGELISTKAATLGIACFKHVLSEAGYVAHSDNHMLVSDVRPTSGVSIEGVYRFTNMQLQRRIDIVITEDSKNIRRKTTEYFNRSFCKSAIYYDHDEGDLRLDIMATLGALQSWGEEEIPDDIASEFIAASATVIYKTMYELGVTRGTSDADIIRLIDAAKTGRGASNNLIEHVV